MGRWYIKISLILVGLVSGTLVGLSFSEKNTQQNIPWSAHILTKMGHLKTQEDVAATFVIRAFNTPKDSTERQLAQQWIDHIKAKGSEDAPDLEDMLQQSLTWSKEVIQ